MVLLPSNVISRSTTQDKTARYCRRDSDKESVFSLPILFFIFPGYHCPWRFRCLLLFRFVGLCVEFLHYRRQVAFIGKPEFQGVRHIFYRRLDLRFIVSGKPLEYMADHRLLFMDRMADSQSKTGESIGS